MQRAHLTRMAAVVVLFCGALAARAGHWEPINSASPPPLGGINQRDRYVTPFGVFLVNYSEQAQPENSILRSNDAVNWTVQQCDLTFNNLFAYQDALYGVAYATPPDEGFRLYRSTDGVDWSDVTENLLPENLRKDGTIFFHEFLGHLWMVRVLWNPNAIEVYENVSSTEWRLAYQAPIYDFRPKIAVLDGTMTIFGLDKWISTSDGVHWRSQSTTHFSPSEFDFQPCAYRHGWFIADGGLFVVSQDAGAQWENLPPPAGQGMVDGFVWNGEIYAIRMGWDGTICWRYVSDGPPAFYQIHDFSVNAEATTTAPLTVHLMLKDGSSPAKVYLLQAPDVISLDKKTMTLTWSDATTLTAQTIVVGASNASGETSMTIHIAFTLPDPPQLTKHPNRIAHGPITVEWTPVEGAESYTVQLAYGSTSPAFSTILTSQNAPSSTTTLSLEGDYGNRLILARVRANFGDGFATGWSPTGRYVLDTIPPRIRQVFIAVVPNDSGPNRLQISVFCDDLPDLDSTDPYLRLFIGDQLPIYLQNSAASLSGVIVTYPLDPDTAPTSQTVSVRLVDPADNTTTLVSPPAAAWSENKIAFTGDVPDRIEVFRNGEFVSSLTPDPDSTVGDVHFITLPDLPSGTYSIWIKPSWDPSKALLATSIQVPRHDNAVPASSWLLFE